MINSIRLLIFSVLCFSSLDGFSQKYTEGWFEFGMISVGLGESGDSTVRDMMAPQMDSILATVYFSKNRISIKGASSLDKSDFVVYDLDARLIYDIDKKRGTYSISEIQLNIDNTLKVENTMKFKNGKSIEDNYLGLTCKEYDLTVKNENLTLIATEDIFFENVLDFLAFPNTHGVLVKLIKTHPFLGVELTMGMKSFSPIIKDKDVFLIDIKGLKNITVSEGDK